MEIQQNNLFSHKKRFRIRRSAERGIMFFLLKDGGFSIRSGSTR